MAAAAAAAAADLLKLPPGFRFHPTDEELVMHYLCKKCASQPIDVPIVAEIDLYKYHPWDLPDMALYGDKEWYFFSPRDRKYPNGSRPNRSAGCGYWKATGADKPICGGARGGPKPIAIKKALVFYAGKAPKGDKTNWIMHEYRLANVDRSARNNNNSLRLDDWILCRIYNKKGTKEKRHPSSNHEIKNNNNNILLEDEEKKPEILKPLPLPLPLVKSDMMYPDISDSIPKMFTESSSSDHTVSPSPGFTSEVQSNTNFSDWDKNAPLGYPFNYSSYDTTFMNMDTDVNGMVINHPSSHPNYQQYHQMSTLQDIFLDFQRPF